MGNQHNAQADNPWLPQSFFTVYLTFGLRYLEQSMDSLHREESFHWKNVCDTLYVVCTCTSTAFGRKTINQISARSFNSQSSENSSVKKQHQVLQKGT